jgi:dynamin 1-like protein
LGVDGAIVPVGRELTGADPVLTSGPMAGVPGNNAAYDMKSLGRHIEAVSSDC